MITRHVTALYSAGNGSLHGGEASLTYLIKTMQLSGIADLQKIILPNGKNVSTEIYFDPLEKSGFMIFSPQIFIGDKATNEITDCVKEIQRANKSLQNMF